MELVSLIVKVVSKGCKLLSDKLQVGIIVYELVIKRTRVVNEHVVIGDVEWVLVYDNEVWASIKPSSFFKSKSLFFCYRFINHCRNIAKLLQEEKRSRFDDVVVLRNCMEEVLVYNGIYGIGRNDATIAFHKKV